MKNGNENKGEFCNFPFSSVLNFENIKFDIGVKRHYRITLISLLRRRDDLQAFCPMKTVTGKVISSEPISLFKATKLLSGFVSSDNGATQAVSAYLRRASAAFIELKSLHKEIRSSSSKETKTRSEVRHERNQRVEFEEVSGVKETDDLVENGGKIVSEDEIKEDKQKKKKKKNREEDVVEEKLEDEQRKEEKKEKKKRKSDGENGSEERKSKKKRKSKEIDD